VIRDKVISEIKSMIEKNSGNKSVDESQSEEKKVVTPKKTTSRKKGTSEPQ
jgi:hypothetical protein